MILSKEVAQQPDLASHLYLDKYITFLPQRGSGLIKIAMSLNPFNKVMQTCKEYHSWQTKSIEPDTVLLVIFLGSLI